MRRAQGVRHENIDRRGCAGMQGRNGKGVWKYASGWSGPNTEGLGDDAWVGKTYSNFAASFLTDFLGKPAGRFQMVIT